MGKYLNDRGFKILEALDKVAEQYNTTPASISISWLLVSAVNLKLDKEAIEILTKASKY